MSDVIARHGLTAAIRDRLDARFTKPCANFWCHVTEGAFATFGDEVLGAGVVFTVLATHLGVQAAELGFLGAIGAFSFLAPLLFAPYVEACRRKKRLVVWLGIGQRLPKLIIPFLLMFLAVREPLLCLLLIALVNLAGGLTTSVLVAPWMDLVGETIPPDRHGHYFGYRHGISAALSLLAGPAAAGVLAAFAFPRNYMALYFASFALMAVSWFIFMLVDELPDDAPANPRAPHCEYFGELARALWRDRNFRWMLLRNILGRTGLAVTVFYVFVAQRFLGMKPAVVVLVWVSTTAAAKVIGNLCFPRLVGRIGHRRMLNIAAALQASAAVTASLAPTWHWFALVGLLIGSSAAASSVSAGPFMLRVAPRGRRIGWQTMSMAIMAPLGMVIGPLAGYGLMHAGWSVIFLIGAVFILASQIPLEHCIPRALPGEGTDGTDQASNGVATEPVQREEEE